MLPIMVKSYYYYHPGNKGKKNYLGVLKRFDFQF
jgi:hypothetical protein